MGDNLNMLVIKSGMLSLSENIEDVCGETVTEISILSPIFYAKNSNPITLILN